MNINTQIENSITDCRDLISAKKIRKTGMSPGAAAAGVIAKWSHWKRIVPVYLYCGSVWHVPGLPLFH